MATGHVYLIDVCHFMTTKQAGLTPSITSMSSNCTCAIVHNYANKRAVGSRGGVCVRLCLCRKIVVSKFYFIPCLVAHSMATERSGDGAAGQYSQCTEEGATAYRMRWSYMGHGQASQVSKKAVHCGIHIHLCLWKSLPIVTMTQERMPDNSSWPHKPHGVEVDPVASVHTPRHHALLQTAVFHRGPEIGQTDGLLEVELSAMSNGPCFSNGRSSPLCPQVVPWVGRYLPCCRRSMVVVPVAASASRYEPSHALLAFVARPEWEGVDGTGSDLPCWGRCYYGEQGLQWMPAESYGWYCIHRASRSV